MSIHFYPILHLRTVFLAADLQYEFSPYAEACTARIIFNTNNKTLTTIRGCALIRRLQTEAQGKIGGDGSVPNSVYSLQ